jgi:hypothetical protein
MISFIADKVLKWGRDVNRDDEFGVEEDKCSILNVQFSTLKQGGTRISNNQFSISKTQVFDFSKPEH